MTMDLALFLYLVALYSLMGLVVIIGVLISIGILDMAIMWLAGKIHGQADDWWAR